MRRNPRISCNQLLIQPNLYPQTLQSYLIHFQVCPNPSIFSTKYILFAVKPSCLKKLKACNPSCKFPFFSIYKSFCPNQTFSCSREKPRCSSYSIDDTNNTQKKLAHISPSGIVESVISRCSYLWETKKKSDSFSKVSLQNILLELSDISPELIRKFWRVSSLKPEDVLEIFLGFDFVCENPAIEARKVGTLWRLFNWASEQNENFENAFESYEIMASMLTQVGSFHEAESFVRNMEIIGLLLGSHEVYSKIIEGHANARELEDSISVFNWTRSQGLVPSQFCYRALFGLLIQMNKTQMAYRVCVDMIEVGFGLSNVETISYDRLIMSLCKEGKVQEARSLVKKGMASGFEPSRAVLNAITDGYCEKRDFEDLLMFLSEVDSVPDASVCNKVLLSQSGKFGTEEAYLFMQELELLGFRPDEIAFGIFISSSCREGKLKDAFIYLSEILSRQLKPDIHSYNAIISGMFKKGMWEQARDVCDDMLERSIKPEISTFRVLLAGYCKFRRFDEVKAVIEEMIGHGLVQISPLEDPLSKAFSLLGFDPLAVKLKRDNDAGLWKAEFFDTLGNGLYLDTDLDDYEKTLMRILDDAIFPDFNALILKECDQGDIETALMMKEKMVYCGQKLSFSAFSALVKHLSNSRSRARKAIDLLEEMPEFAQQLQHGTLNLLIRVMCKKGVPLKGKLVLDWLLQRDMPVENETYTALIMGLHKKGSLKEFLECWELACKDKWLPLVKDCKVIVSCLCLQGMLEEVLKLLRSMVETHMRMISEISDVFLEQLCDGGFASIGQIFVDEVLEHDWVLNHTAYSYLMRGFLKEKRYEEAFRILDAMLKKNMAPSLDAYNMLIPQLCRFNRLDKAMALKEIMLQNEAEAPHLLYNILLNGLCSMQQINLVILQFREIMVNGISPDADTYNLMILGYCQDNNSPRGVLELLGIMVKNNFNLSISSYRSLVSLMCLQGRVFHALRLKDFMLRQTGIQFLIIYNILIFRLLQTGNSAFVSELLDEMLGKNLVFDEFTFNFLICGFCKCENVSRSMKLLETMSDNNLTPSKRSLRTVIKHLCNHRNPEKALELSRVMELRGWVHDSTVQNVIVGCLLSHRHVQEAEDYLHRIEGSGLIPKNINYDSLIKLFSWYGRPNTAVDLVNMMLKKGRLPNPASYDSVIQGFCAHKAVDKALDFHAEMLVRGFTPCVKSWDMLIYGLCAMGRTAESERLLDSMISLGLTPTRNIFQSVINRYYSENNLNKASELLHKMQQNGYVPDFRTHWTLISNLSNATEKESSNGGGFLSNLLSRSGFNWKKDSKGT